MIKALLPKPFKILSMTSGGRLQIPDESSMAQCCLVTLSDRSSHELAEWREKFIDVGVSYVPGVPPNGGLPSPIQPHLCQPHLRQPQLQAESQQERG